MSELTATSATTPKYGIVLLGIVAVILLSAASGEANPFGAMALLVQGALLIFTVRISETNRRWINVVVGAAAVCVVLGAASILLSDEFATLPSEIVAMLFAVVTPVVIGRRIRREGRVDGLVVAGALCIYLMIGLFYVQVYGVIDRFDDGAFFVQTTDPSPVDFTYFSYVTMTTVGYGDLTAASGLSRMVAVTEALIGQIYLVTIVALAVSRVRPGPGARLGTLASDEADSDAAPQDRGEDNA
jgi:uncharacterized membrane protein